MPYPYDNRGLLGRWQNPMQRPMLTQPAAQPQLPQPRPPQNYGQMPWDETQGQGFADMYAPKPKPKPAAARPSQPAAPPIQMPMQQPLPDQMPSSDPGMSAYGMPAQGAGGMQMPKPPMQYDAAMSAYPDQQQVQRQPQPGEQATGDNAGDGKLFGFDGMEWLNMGLALMTGANQNGGSFEPLMQTVGNMQQTRRQDQRLAVEDKRYDAQMARQTEADAREAELHGLRIGELKYGEEQRTRLAEAQKQAIESAADPQTKAALAGMTPEQYGAFLGQRIMSADEMKARAEAERIEREFRAGQAALDRDTQLNAAKLRNPNETARGRSDLAQLQPWQEAAGLAQTYTLNRVGRMKEIITQLGAMNGVNQPIGADDRVQLGRWGLASKEAQGLLQEYKQLLGQFTRDEAQKLKPVSNVDIEGIEKQLANGDTEVGAAMRMLTRMEDEMIKGIDRTNQMVNWFDSGNSFSGRNAEGKTFYEASGFQMPSAPSSTPTAAAPVAASAAKAPPAVGTKRIVDGVSYIYVGGDPNNEKSWQTAQPGAYRGR